MSRELVQTLQEDEYSRNLIVPVGGIKRSTLYGTVNDRGLEQHLYVFSKLQKNASAVLSHQYAELGCDRWTPYGFCFIHAMAEYSINSKKEKLHLDFNLNNGIPRKLFLTEGKWTERPFDGRIIDPGQTVVLDRGYQATSFWINGKRMIATSSSASRGRHIKRCYVRILSPRNLIYSLTPQ